MHTLNKFDYPKLNSYHICRKYEGRHDISADFPCEKAQTNVCESIKIPCIMNRN